MQYSERAMPPDNVAVQFIDVHKRFEGLAVLDGMDLDIPWGKVTTILGPSGVGKSVALKHIIGILKADRGRVIVDGQDMAAISRMDLIELRKRIGVLFQSSALFDSMDVGENVGFALRMHTSKSEREIDERVRVCLEQVDMSGVDEMMPVELSGGMRKRAALARAIALAPDFVLYDEPTTGLDPRTANMVGDLILKLQGDLDITSVVVTHDIPLTLRVSDKVALICHGKVETAGSPEEVQENEVYREFVSGDLEMRGNNANP